MKLFDYFWACEASDYFPDLTLTRLPGLVSIARASQIDTAVCHGFSDSERGCSDHHPLRDYPEAVQSECNG